MADFVKDDVHRFGAKKRIAGLKLTATDMDWSHGNGPEVKGPAEALVMMMAGRLVALDDLSGEGKRPLWLPGVSEERRKAKGANPITGTHMTYGTTARSDGEFVVRVPAGSYRITGRDIGQTGGLPGCGSPIVHVSSGQVTHVSVTCVFHLVLGKHC